MQNKKIVSVLLVSALVASQSASAAFDMGSSFGNMNMGNVGTDSDEGSFMDSAVGAVSDEDAASNGSETVSDSQLHTSNYDVNGDLVVNGVLYVFGNLDVNGTLTVGKHAKVRVLGKLTVNGELDNQGGSVYAAKKDVNGGNSGKARTMEALLAEIDPLLSVKIIGEEREGILQDIADSKGFVRTARLQEFLDSLDDKIEERDAATYEKIKTRLVKALERKIKQMGGLKDAQLDVFGTKLESMPTAKLENFVSKLEKLQKATKKKRFAFQVSQLKELAEEIIEARQASIDEDGAPASQDTTTGANDSTTGSGTTDSTSGQTSGTGTSDSTSGQTSGSGTSVQQ